MQKCLMILCCLLTAFAGQANPERIIVSQDGKGQFKTIQAALNSLPKQGAAPVVIFIKKGVYNEKLYIEKSHVTLEGEDRGNTIIIASIARDEWRCEHPDDWGVATMNIGATDITLKHLTVTNSFGFDFKPTTINCASDTTADKQRVLRKDGHQMALRAMNGATRLSAIDCHFRAFGGDTVSPWDIDIGLWYFKDCTMEGGVDFYCPRGWAWAENCTFITLTGPAAIWHDGSKHQDSKTVLKDCKFIGYDGFSLGRYHKDAQFYLIDCSFGANMKDKDIYLVPTTNTIQWGRRIYYAGCHKQDGKDFAWFQDNLPASITKKNITIAWVFGEKWNPQKTEE